MNRGLRGLRRAPIALLAACCLAVLAACGLPADGASRDIQPQDIPYGLTSPAPSASPTSSGSLRLLQTEPRTYLLDPVQQLVAVPTPVDPGVAATAQEQLLVLLKVLAAGPSERERAEGLSTALTPGIVIDLVALQGRTATLEVHTTTKEPAADRLPLGIGQIVLTSTSVPGVGSVQLVQDGQPVEVPLPGGALTSAPLQRSDYRELIAVPTPTAPSSGG
ncbi:GerMN domain-containing protein [Angustibacter sp. McL0619]|uniref:GerMN domain-containing protein n=1 Tax=Angustibacter sp. McL0619 TaxID=3415676 RepID=UPI003CED91EF